MRILGSKLAERLEHSDYSFGLWIVVPRSASDSCYWEHNWQSAFLFAFHTSCSLMTKENG